MSIIKYIFILFIRVIMYSIFLIIITFIYRPDVINLLVAGNNDTIRKIQRKYQYEILANGAIPLNADLSRFDRVCIFDHDTNPTLDGGNIFGKDIHFTTNFGITGWPDISHVALRDQKTVYLLHVPMNDVFPFPFEGNLCAKQITLEIDRAEKTIKIKSVED